MDFRLEPFLKKHGGGLFIAYMIVATIPLFTYETESDASFWFAFKYLGAPIVLLCFCIYLFKMPSYRLKAGQVKGTLFTLLLAALLVLMSGSYVLLANAWGPGQRDVVVRGKIIGLRLIGGRKSTTYTATILADDGNTLRFDLKHADYEGLALGQPYSEHWKVGALGLLYR